MSSRFIRWSDDKILSHANILADIEEKAKKLGLDGKKISDLFLTLLDQGFLKGRSTIAVEAACFLVYIRQNDIPIPEKVIVEMFGISRDKLFVTYRDIVTKLGIKIPPPSIESRIHYVATNLNLSSDIVNESLQFVEKCKDILRGKNPNVAAAAVVWLIAKKHGLHITQVQLSKMLHVTDAGVREVVRALKTAGCIVLDDSKI